MSSVLFQYDNYLLKRQVFALTGKFRIFDARENLLLFSTALTSACFADCTASVIEVRHDDAAVTISETLARTV